ncbi:hypothetical protein [Actinophytocola oryzae]|uniref:Uncharacterized protein n=1 Tax=Actinophytocola oryzae TaxID=502181 RepID=A0A4R7VD00_9PSEU|nr:hypothetical protein [Actinophytocola oryzae]TDV47006.1 hypothetical protein CLV71_110189 [Actinophytocola oryzae]
MQDVEAVVEELADRDDAGLVVAACWYDVSNDRPNYLMSQFDVQNFLWLTLPQLLRDPPVDLDPMPTWREVVDEAAWFFERLDQPRYAAICRGPRTHEILASAQDAIRSFELYAQATHESGIMPPPGLRISWLDHPGPREQALYDAITRALERAIAAGELDPADDAKRLAVAATVLDQLPDGHTETMQDLMLAERMTTLGATFGSQTARELLVRVEPDVAKPLDLTPELLLAGTRPLGQVVHDRDGSGPLCAMAQKLGLLDEDLDRTDEGERALAHPVLLFEAVVGGFATPADRVAAQAALPLLCMLILADTIDVDMLLDRVAIVFFETGRGDAPWPSDSVRSAVYELLADMRTVGIVAEDRLTDFGRRVALTGIRTRAMQARDD